MSSSVRGVRNRIKNSNNKNVNAPAQDSQFIVISRPEAFVGDGEWDLGFDVSSSNPDIFFKNVFVLVGRIGSNEAFAGSQSALIIPKIDNDSGMDGTKWSFDYWGFTDIGIVAGEKIWVFVSVDYNDSGYASTRFEVVVDEL
ncbi:hypothetical protein [Nitrospirillum sp. BR 11828]|uniref:hypothetical protein n=1 Tax=Nitrospirillum sp. BR 11828 TaxID=3104325 RepID=UPI002ACAF5AA|nr:hypothetical protein [Nitrospirillum sp. BR 11828]MDZ5648548.1 hypothetical protein [Nitrospirillum sp. BR 11828]